MEFKKELEPWTGVEETQENTLNVILKALITDSKIQPLIHRTLQVINTLKSKLNEANLLLVEGLLCYSIDRGPFKYFAEAEIQGCNHPLLFFYSGECYREGNRGVPKDISKAIEYYDMSIAGGYYLGHLAVADIYRSGEGDVRETFARSLSYLTELESQGYTANQIFKKMAHLYHYGNGFERYLSRALDCYHRSVYTGYIPADQTRYYLSSYCDEHNSLTSRDKTILSLLEIEKNGVRDDKLIEDLIQAMHGDTYTPSLQVLGKHKNKRTMILHYCRVLIHMRSPRGYYWKGRFFWNGEDGVPKTKSKAVSIWKEADRLGLADFNMYISQTSGSLVSAYSDGDGVSQNGAKVLEYCEKALSIAMTMTDKRAVYLAMANVYEKGIPPIAQDLEQAGKLRRLAAAGRDSRLQLKVPKRDHIPCLIQ